MGRGLSEAEALLRIAAQLPCAEKARRADYALWNTGSIEALRRAAESLFERLVENTL
jgi:dephospho-CoA kinase